MSARHIGRPMVLAIVALLVMGACYGDGGCPDSIAACQHACANTGGMASFSAKDGCRCNAVDGGSR